MAIKNLISSTLLLVFLQASLGLQNVVRAQDRNEILGDPMIYYTTTELACSDGYPVQDHKVVTEDGYVLTVHRIPAGRIRRPVPHRKEHYHKIHLNNHPDFDDCIRESLNVTSKGIPIVLAHGFLLASDGWLLQGPGYDLAYLLADQGYDVWMANVRGNFYSRKHITMSSSEPRFWDFSFHESAKYDYPALIDYIIKVTKKEKVGYIGYSMGTITFLAMTSLRPEYNDKILGFVALAPVTFIRKNELDPMRRQLFDLVIEVAKNLENRGYIHEFLPRTNRLLRLGKNFCSKGSGLQDFCYELVTVVLGYRSKLVLRDKLHLYLTHVPTGTSLKTVTHFAQMFQNGWFKPFDYGTSKNIEMYGSPIPPDYPVWNITAPIALYYAGGDFFYFAKGLDRLRHQLRNVVEVSDTQKFNHADFIWSYRAKDLVYWKVLSFFQKLRDQYYVRSRKRSSGS